MDMDSYLFEAFVNIFIWFNSVLFSDGIFFILFFY